MKIVKFKKIGKEKYKVYFDDEEIVLYEDVIIKYSLLSKKDIDLIMLENILEDNLFYEVYNRALNYIDVKMRNEKELREYLIRKTYDEVIIDKVMEKLKDENFIDNEKYVKAYVNDRIHLSSYGPYRIKNDLLKFNIEEYIIDDYLNTIDDEVWINKIKKIIEKKIKLNKKFPNNILKLKISEYLFYLGYEKDIYMLYLNEMIK